MIDSISLVDALQKFQRWNDEYNDIVDRYYPNDGAVALMSALGIDKDAVMCLVGGSNAPIFKRAIKEIESLREQVEKMNDVFTKIRVTAVACPHGGETSDDQPWLPESLMLEIDGTMKREHRA